MDIVKRLSAHNQAHDKLRLVKKCSELICKYCFSESDVNWLACLQRVSKALVRYSQYQGQGLSILELYMTASWLLTIPARRTSSNRLLMTTKPKVQKALHEALQKQAIPGEEEDQMLYNMMIRCRFYLLPEVLLQLVHIPLTCVNMWPHVSSCAQGAL